MALTGWHARHLVTAGVQIHTRLPRLREAVERGLLPEQLAIDAACRLASIPDDIIEAAEMDGITGWSQFWRIKLPLILPAIGIISILTFVGMLSGIAGGLVVCVLALDISPTMFFNRYY